MESPLRRDIFPTVDFGLVIVQTTYPGASPQDVELNVTNPIEDELRDAERTERELRNAVARVTDLPDEVIGAPLVLEIDTSLINSCEVGIVGDLPYREKRETAEAMERQEIPLREIVPAIRARNIRLTAGSFESFTGARSTGSSSPRTSTAAGRRGTPRCGRPSTGSSWAASPGSSRWR